MPNIKSAIKKARQDEVRRARNKARKTALKGSLKKMRLALAGKKTDDAKALLPDTLSTIDKMAKRGLIHRNAANRHKSRLSTRLSALLSGK
jgi:small subunit ribosomal protein S20